MINNPTKIRCLAHVINLATQSLLSTYSKTKHFDPAAPYEHEPDVDAITRDEVGLLRAVGVKARSSSKRKGRIYKIQKAVDQKPLVLIVDMKVRWSSTYNMLNRACLLRIVRIYSLLYKFQQLVTLHSQYLKDFIWETSREEPDLRKRPKIEALVLGDDEWTRVYLLRELLEVSNNHKYRCSSSLIFVYSMPIAPNRPFRMTINLPSKRRFQPLKLCIRCGATVGQRVDIPPSQKHWRRQYRRSKITTTRRQRLMPILWLCVCISVFFACSVLINMNSTRS
jgi:hypothetical protein